MSRLLVLVLGSTMIALGGCGLEENVADDGERLPAGSSCDEGGGCTPDGELVPYGLEGTMKLKGTASALKYTRITVIGDSSNITRIYFVNHGDGNSDYASSTASDRKAMAKHLAAGEGAIVAYPVSISSNWPAFDGGKNGALLLSMYRELEQLVGGKNIRFEQFSLSGGGRVNHALLRLINERYASDADVREFVDLHLRGIHDGDSLCYSIDKMRAAYIEAIQRFAPLRFCFIHNTSGKMAYVHTHHNTIAKTIGGKSYPYGGELELQDGRLRFWSAKTHWTAWQSQFERVFFGTTWGEDPNPPQPPTPTPTPPTPPTPTPPAADRWLGDACAAASKCASQSCLQSAGATSFPGGMCSQPCSQLCPDRAGEPTSFCVSFDAASGKFGGTQGQCFARCDTGAHPGSGCREGYACVKLARNKQSSVKRNVCVPQQPTALGGDGQGSVQLIGEPPDADGDRPNPEQEAAGGGGEELDASGLTGGAGCALAPAAPADDSAPLLLLGLAAIAVLARRRR